MDPIGQTTVIYELTIEDYREMTAHLFARGGLRKRMSARLALYLALFLFVFATTFVMVRSQRSGISFAAGVFVGAMIVLGSVLLNARTSTVALRKLEPRKGGAYLCSYELSSTSEELIFMTRTWRSSMRWSAFIAVEETQDLLLILFDPGSAHAIPKRAFLDAEHLARFRHEAELRITANASAQPG